MSTWEAHRGRESQLTGVVMFCNVMTVLKLDNIFFPKNIKRSYRICYIWELPIFLGYNCEFAPTREGGGSESERLTQSRVFIEIDQTI